MSSGASFTSLPREIRDQIYKEILVRSKPEPTMPTVLPHIWPRPALLNPASSNPQIAREACEVYYKYNTFVTPAVGLSKFLACELYVGDAELFSPGAYVQKIFVNIDFMDSSMSDSLAVDFHGISLSCPNLRTVILRCSVEEFNRAPLIPQCFGLKGVTNIIYLCRRLKSEISDIQLELYLPGFCYNKAHLIPQVVGASLGPCNILKEKSVTWLMDEPDQETIEKLKKGEGTIQEWLMAKMARKWAPIKEKESLEYSDEEF